MKYDHQFFKIVKKQIEKTDFSFNKFSVIKMLNLIDVFVYMSFDYDGRCWKF